MTMSDTISDEELNSVCMSYRHDFGLLPETDRQTLRLQAKYWREAWDKNTRSSAGAVKADCSATCQRTDGVTCADDECDIESGSITPAYTPNAEQVTAPGHCYDPSDWEYTMPWDGRNELVDDWEVNKVHRVATLIDGPDKWVVLCWDEVNGEEIRWFDSEADALDAMPLQENTNGK